MMKIKRNHYSKSLLVFLSMVDCMLLLISYRIAFQLQFGTAFVPAGHYQALLAICLLGWVIASLFSGAYQPDNLKSFTRIVRATFGAFLLYALILVAYLAFLDPYHVAEQFMVISQVLFASLTILVKYVMLLGYSLLRNRKKNRSRTIIVGYTNAGRELYSYFTKRKNYGFEFLGFFDNAQEGKLIAGKLDEIKDFCITHGVNEIYYALPNREDLIRDLTHFADNHFIHFGLVQDLTGLSYNRLHAYNYGNEIPVITYSKTSASRMLSSKLYSDLYVKMKNIPFSN